MAALFEVPAYPDSVFTGRVTQIRLQPKVVSNVVNYTVVIEADNPGNILMPGMTATVDFILDEKRDVLMVSNTALSFEPSRTVLASMREKMAKQRTDNGGDSSMEKPPTESGDSNSMARVGDSTSSETTQMPLRTMPSNMKVLWTLDSEGNLNPLPVTTGATDGKNTEITPLRDEIPEGTQIVVKMPEEESNGSSNPFMPRGPGGRR
jgi:HlyD family secretion protein